jgi:uncharacterized membrane protein HdeD (DUF308 family)
MIFDDRLSGAERVTRGWGIFLLAGVIWLVLSLIGLQFNASTSAGAGKLVPALAFLAGINELTATRVTSQGWKHPQVAFALAFICAGLVALLSPVRSCAFLASVAGFAILLNGGFDVVSAFVSKGVHDLWWVQLSVGSLELILALSLCASAGRQEALLPVALGAWCLARGMTQFVLAFQLRALYREAGYQPAAGSIRR